MGPSELRADVQGELEQMRVVVRELVALPPGRRRSRAYAPRESSRSRVFLRSSTTVVENVLKRISKYHGAALPEGDRWHAELFSRFCSLPAAAEREVPAAVR